MASESGDRRGADLKDGVPLEELPEGKPFLGELGGERVVLVRRGSAVSAVGATCTHYGGPLDEGLVVGDTIHCPWHHACFSLRTGEALGAPALNPIPTWEVEVRGGRVYVSGKTELEPLAAEGRRAAGPESVVIVGAGAGGSAAAEMLRREGYEGPIALVDPDAAAPYDRPNLSKDYLAGNAPEEWLPLRPADFWAAHGIERIVAGVVSVDVGRREVELEDGTKLPFGALLLAPGARPRRLEVEGGDLPHVRVLRSLADCRAIIAAAEGASRVVVVGAGFIGMEVAASLRSRGPEVTVIAPDPVPFHRTLGEELGREIQRTHEANGVAFRLGRTVAAIDRDSVRLDDGTTLPADLVIVGIGVQPDTRLAEGAGLRVDGGVLVDAYLETSAPGVFAAGDSARYPDPITGEPTRVEHWVAAQRQGQTAARNILGRRLAHTDPPFFWTHQWDLALGYVGNGAGWERIESEGSVAERDASLRFVRSGRTIAVATVGRDLENLEAEAALAAAAGGDAGRPSAQP